MPRSVHRQRHGQSRRCTGLADGGLLTEPQQGHHQPFAPMARHECYATTHVRPQSRTSRRANRRIAVTVDGEKSRPVRLFAPSHLPLQERSRLMPILPLRSKILALFNQPLLPGGEGFSLGGHGIRWIPARYGANVNLLATSSNHRKNFDPQHVQKGTVTSCAGAAGPSLAGPGERASSSPRVTKFSRACCTEGLSLVA